MIYDLLDFSVSLGEVSTTLVGCRILTLKAPITTAADDIHKYFFIVFQRK